MTSLLIGKITNDRPLGRRYGTPWPLEFTCRLGWPAFELALHKNDRVAFLVGLASDASAPKQRQLDTMIVERACFFVVARIMGKSTPMIFWDELPRAPIRGLEYVLRLDTFPNGTELVHASLAKLFEVYRHMKTRGKLPPRWEPPKPAVAVST